MNYPESEISKVGYGSTYFTIMHHRTFTSFINLHVILSTNAIFVSGAISCNLTLSSPDGTFTSPNYPSNYPPNTSCSYVISLNENPKGQSHVQLSITDFELNAGDYVVIYDGREEMVELARYSMASGDLVYRPLNSSGHDMLVVFISDMSAQAKGFNINYITKSE